MRDSKLSFILLFTIVGIFNNSKATTDKWLTVILNFKCGVLSIVCISPPFYPLVIFKVLFIGVFGGFFRCRVFLLLLFLQDL